MQQINAHQPAPPGIYNNFTIISPNTQDSKGNFIEKSAKYL
jgi:hypothetical protein